MLFFFFFCLILFFCVWTMFWWAYTELIQIINSHEGMLRKNFMWRRKEKEKKNHLFPYVLSSSIGVIFFFLIFYLWFFSLCAFCAWLHCLVFETNFKGASTHLYVIFVFHCVLLYLNQILKENIIKHRRTLAETSQYNILC